MSPGRNELGTRPVELDRIPRDRMVSVDVRDELRAGREPFGTIMAARRTVPDGGGLCVRAIFEPVPLYAVMRRQGMVHWTEQRAADDWLVWFYPEPDAGAPTRSAPAGATTTASAAIDGNEPEGDVVVLDVRGLEPPEPMMRTLEALESLPAGATLVQINARIPRFLLPLLEERGFSYEVRSQGQDLVRTFIRRRDDDRGEDS